jgi:hypothetical protein
LIEIPREPELNPFTASPREINSTDGVVTDTGASEIIATNDEGLPIHDIRENVDMQETKTCQNPSDLCVNMVQVQEKLNSLYQSVVHSKPKLSPSDKQWLDQMFDNVSEDGDGGSEFSSRNTIPKTHEPVMSAPDTRIIESGMIATRNSSKPPKNDGIPNSKSLGRVTFHPSAIKDDIQSHLGSSTNGSTSNEATKPGGPLLNSAALKMPSSTRNPLSESVVERQPVISLEEENLIDEEMHQREVCRMNTLCPNYN